MKWVYIEDIASHKDQEAEVRSWVTNKRSSGKARFLLIRDGTGILQTTVSSEARNHPLFDIFDRNRERPAGFTGQDTRSIRAAAVEEASEKVF